jgi:chromosome segregation ATPase
MLDFMRSARYSITMTIAAIFLGLFGLTNSMNLTKAQTALAAVKDSNASLEYQVAELEDHLTTAKKTIEDSKKELAEMDAKLATTRETTVRLSNEKAQMTAAINKKNVALIKASRDLEIYSAKLKTLEQTKVATTWWGKPKKG